MSLSDNNIIIDHYPTRTTGRAPHVHRVHPVVWGEVESEALGSFERDGYVALDALLGPDEVAVLSAEVERLTREPELRLDERVVIEKSSNRIRSIFQVHRLSAAIAGLVRDERISGLARQILGSEVYIHQSRINYMPGMTGTGFYWHSDFETWHAEDGMPAPRAVSLSIALTENYPFNGSLMVMPGSHRTFVPCIGVTPARHYRDSLREQKIGVPGAADITALALEHGIAQFTGKPGSALLFDSNIMHGSANNITPFPCSNIFIVFNSVENALVDPYASESPRPDYIASRDFTAIL